MDFNTRVKLAVYGHFAATGQAPRLADIADELKCTNTGRVPVEMVDTRSR